MWWWLSFRDPDLPNTADGSQFLGVTIVEGDDIGEAASRAAELGINPGGEVVGVPIFAERLPNDRLLNRLLSADEIFEWDIGVRGHIPES